jgi:hypothetical protein
MGRKRKFGEESDFVSVRVPKSKRKEYRIAIKKFVERKFAIESLSADNVPKEKLNKVEIIGFRKFEEFLRDIKQLEKKKE